jgi:hypothetical protein
MKGEKAPLVVAGRLISKKSRRDKTAIELSLTGARDSGAFFRVRLNQRISSAHCAFICDMFRSG